MNRLPGIGGTDLWSISDSSQQLSLDVIDLGPISLAIRPQLAWRRFNAGGNEYFYLSFHDRELERRVVSISRCVHERQFTPNDIRAVGFCLEPTDTMIVVNQDDVIVFKGGACAIPVYWRSVGEQIVITTHLPHPSESGLSRHGLITSFAVVGATLQNDQNLILQSPVAGWTKVRRGAATRWAVRGQSFRCAEVAIDFAEAPLHEHLQHYDGIVEALRNQIEIFRESQTDIGRTVFELSGGMDSTLATWGAPRQLKRPLGISISFPFYEFRYEEGIQIETAKSLDADRVVVDGRNLYAYAPQECRLSLDEPAIICMIANRDETFARIARDAGADTILVGEGGDQLLSEHLLQPMQVSDQIDRSVMRAQGRLSLDSVVRKMRTAPAVYLNRSTLNFSYDSRLVPAIKERWRVTTRTPFTDLGMTMCGIAYAKWCAGNGFNTGKKIIVDAFADILPEAILRRRGKVSWEGVYARTYVANEDSLSEEFESCHDALEEIGFDVQWLLGRVRALGRLEATEYGRDDREVMSAYAIAYWLNEKGISKRVDCTWVD